MVKFRGCFPGATLLFATTLGGGAVVQALPSSDSVVPPAASSKSSILDDVIRSRLLHGSIVHDGTDDHHHAEEPKCGDTLGRITTTEIEHIMDMYLTMLKSEESTAEGGTSTSNQDLIDTAIKTLLNIIQYDLQVMKICGSCEDIWENFKELGITIDQLSNSDKFGFSTYCAPWSHAYTAKHSSLVFIPINPFSDEIFENAVLKVVMTGRSDRINLHDAPTSSWPRTDIVGNITNMFNTNNGPTWSTTNVQMAYMFRSTIVPLMSASSGSVSIMPDFLGFGETSTQEQNYQRPYITPLPYQQSFVVSYFSVLRYFDLLNKNKKENNSIGRTGSSRSSNSKHTGPSCTLIDKVVTVTGYSEGGYGALVGSLSLEKLGIRIVSTHLGGSPLHLDRQTGFTFGT